MTDTDLPDWLYVGAPVAEYTQFRGYRYDNSAHETVVMSINRYGVTVASGDRYLFSQNLRRRVGGTWGYDWYLVPRSDETYLRIQKDREILGVIFRVRGCLRAWQLERGELEPVRAAVEILSRYLSAEEIARD